MAVIVFSSPKGGCGKTTAATLLATELATRGANVIVIDADPNRNVADWAKLPGAPASLSIIDHVTEETIVDEIETAAAKAAFVIVDLEGTANWLVGLAITTADFVVIPVQGSQLDAKQAGRQIKLIRQQERAIGRAIPFAVLFTRTSPAIMPRTQRHIENRFAQTEIPAFATRLCDREAYRAMFSYGGTLSGLDRKNVSNLDQAIQNARLFVGELVERLRDTRTQAREIA